MPSGGNLTPHAPGKRRRIGPMMRVDDGETLAASIFHRQGTQCGYHSTNLTAVFPNYSSLYLVFLYDFTLSCAIFPALAVIGLFKPIYVLVWPMPISCVL